MRTGDEYGCDPAVQDLSPVGAFRFQKLFVAQVCHSGQGLAFKEFEGSASAG